MPRANVVCSIKFFYLKFVIRDRIVLTIKGFVDGSHDIY